MLLQNPLMQKSKLSGLLQEEFATSISFFLDSLKSMLKSNIPQQFDLIPSHHRYDLYSIGQVLMNVICIR